MRVVLNQWAAAGRKTGIGHCVAQLMHFLPQEAGDDEVSLFPPAWVQRYRDLWGRLSNDGAAGPSVPGAPAAGAPRRLRTWARSLLRGVGRTVNAWHFRQYCRRRRIDLYHEPNYIPFPSDVPTVSTLHDLSVLLHPEWHPADRVAHYERHFADTLSRCVHFLTVSEFTRQEVIRYLNVPPERVTRVYNGTRPNLAPLPRPQVEEALHRLGLPPRYLLHVGTIEPRKNLLMLMRAYCALPAPVRERWPLLLVGSWGWNIGEIQAYWHGEGRHRGVLHVGYVSEDDLAAVYNGARALLCPSLYEGFGLPPVEMLACGGAVITSTAGALVETAGGRAHLLDPADTDGWRDALARVTADDDWWQGLRRGAVEAARRFTWRRSAAETWAVYRAVHAGLHGASRPQPRLAA